MKSRRRFLVSGLGLGGSLLLGCSSEDLNAGGGGGSGGGGDEEVGGSGGSSGDDLAERGTLVEEVAFVGETDTPLNRPFNQGLDGRLYTDLSTLDGETPITPNDNFYIRTRYPDLLVPEVPWTIRLGGLIDGPSELVLDDLLPLEADQGAVLMECSGNARGAAFGLLSSAEWAGIPFNEVLDRISVRPEATRVLVSGFDEYSQASTQSQPGASWVFSFAELERAGAFLATQMNGAPLPRDHGAPVRLLVPGWYGCTCIKWVNEILLVADDEPSTAQMREFASRTQQTGTPQLASGYVPAEIDVAAMPVRVEKWLLDGRTLYRVVGIVWGGSVPATGLEISFGGGDWQPVTDYAPPAGTRTWSLWSTRWSPSATGTYAILLRVTDPDIRTRRLDNSYYLREVAIDEV